MYIHKEGYRIIAATIAIVIVLISLMHRFIDSWNWYWYFLSAGIIILALIIIRFFRIPARELVHNPNQIIS